MSRQDLREKEFSRTSWVNGQDLAQGPVYTTMFSKENTQLPLYLWHLSSWQLCSELLKNVTRDTASQRLDVLFLQSGLWSFVKNAKVWLHFVFLFSWLKAVFWEFSTWPPSKWRKWHFPGTLVLVMWLWPLVVLHMFIRANQNHNSSVMSSLQSI